MKNIRLLAWVLLLALALTSVAMAEPTEPELWEYEEPNYLEMTVAAGDIYTGTGFVMLEERGNVTYPGHESTEMVCFFYPDQPLELNVNWEADQVSAVMPEKLHIVSATEDLGKYSGQRAVVTGNFAIADEFNCYATVVALENVTVVPETVEELPIGFALEPIGDIGDITQVSPAELPGWTQADAASGTVYVTATGGDSNVRKKPNLQAGVVTVLKKGEGGKYLGETKRDDRGVDWYYISRNGVKGWVSSKYTTMGGASAPADSAYVVADGGKSNMRKAPNLEGKIICTFRKGDYAVYLNRSSVDERGVTWYNVAYRDSTGWVSSRYTSLICTGGGNRVSATANVFVRLGPGLGYGICDVLNAGETREYKGDTYHDDRGVAWYRIAYKNGAGWVSSRYSKLVK